MRLPPPEDLVEAFVVSNLGFLGVDIVLAHAENSFGRPVEWLPVVFSAIVTVLLLPGLFHRGVRARTRGLAIAIGLAAVAVGVAGMVFHLDSAFFVRRTLHDLVYSAPFIAPLSYVGVGLLLVLSRLEPAGTDEWNGWVVFLALGGFGGNLALSLLDHAQNGFFSWAEWLPVVAAAFAVSFLSVALFRRRDERLLRVCLGVLAAEVIVGIAGALLHVRADLGRPGATITDKLVFGAPAFAPMLFADLSALAAIGLGGMLRRAGQGEGWASSRGAAAS
jgi:hypothetical protein